MITNPGHFLDQSSHAGQRPQIGLVALGAGAGHEGVGHRFHLLRGQPGLGARWTFARQSQIPPLIPGLLPSVGNLPGNPKPTGHLRDGNIPFVELARLPAALLQLGMVSRLRHARSLHRTPKLVTLLCGAQ